MAGYTRQSTYTDGDIIQASDSNDEFDQLLAAFDASTGHAHDGTAAEGPVIKLIGDAGLATPLNKVEIDTANARMGFYINVASSAVEQVRIQDGAIVPVTDNDVDLGTSSLKFKDGYFAGDLTVDGNITLGGDITLGDADTDTITLGAEVASHVVPDVDNTYDLGSVSKEWRNLYIDGTANIDSLVADTADINAGTIDNTVIGGTTPAAADFTTMDTTGNATIGGTFGVTGAVTLSSTLDVTGTTTLGTAAITTGNITNVNATTVDTTNLEVTNIKAKDGTASATIANSTGVMTVSSAVLTTADINGGTIDNAVIGGGTAAAGSFTTLAASGNATLSANLTVNGNTTLGNAATDTVTFTADIASNMLPSADDTYDLGAVGSEWKDLYIDGVAYIDTLTIGSSTGITSVDTDLSTVSASDDTLASAKAIKAYVDSQVTAQDLDLTTDSGTIAIDLDSETLTIAGGTGLDSSATGNTVTLAIDSTVATLTGTQTLTNKTLTTPVISQISNTGTLTLPTSTDTLVARDTTDTLTNKTIDSASNTITVDLSEATVTGTLAEFNTALSDGSFASLAGTETLTNKTLTSPTIDLSTVTSSGDLAVADGGTGASTAAGARTNLDVDQAGTALALAIALG